MNRHGGVCDDGVCGGYLSRGSVRGKVRELAVGSERTCGGV
jgi:hypothetical protein